MRILEVVVVVDDWFGVRVLVCICCYSCGGGVGVCMMFSAGDWGVDVASCCSVVGVAGGLGSPSHAVYIASSCANCLVGVSAMLSVRVAVKFSGVMLVMLVSARRVVVVVGLHGGG